MFREPIAEFAGLMFLTIFGLGPNCQATFSSDPAVSPSHKGMRSLPQYLLCQAVLNICYKTGDQFLWGGVLVMLAMATWREFPWKKGPRLFLISRR
ncbi:hypothetical protein DXG01_005527 [Tephrocybe rancida]|nr:hypothetical protein DXG01_005527 [Tephrocybe rancida]